MATDLDGPALKLLKITKCVSTRRKDDSAECLIWILAVEIKKGIAVS